MTDHRVEVGNDSNRVQHIAATYLLVGLDPHDTQLPQGRHPAGEQIDRLENRLGDHRFHDVELKLSRLSGEGQRHIVSHDLEADLVHHLGDHRIDLCRHDGGSGLAFRQPDLPQPRTRSGGQQAQVVADLGQLHRQTLDRRVHRDVGTCVTRGFQQVMRSSNVQTGDLPQTPDNSALIVRRRVEPRADRRGPEVHLQKQGGIVVKPADLLLQQNGEGLELLPQAHRNSILKLSTPHLQNMDELGSLGSHRRDESLELLDERTDEGEQSQTESGRVSVVRRLGLVDMIVGIDDVITALGVSQVLQREVGDHLVGIHVDAGPSTPLELVDRELIEATLSNQHLVTRPHNRTSDLRVKSPKITVR